MSTFQLTQEHRGSWLENLACGILRYGQVPKHVAFIMDGNRRYADKSRIGKADGHKEGFNTLAKVLSWCRDLHINQVTLYAFSIENFKRTKDEVTSIMNLAREKCDSILDELDKINENGLRIRVAGDIELLPQDIRERVQRIQDLTCNNDRAILNVCLAYTARHEIVAAIKRLSVLVNQEKVLTANEIETRHFEQELYITRPFPDLIIRTSGEVRLSDFMLWQCQDSILMFVDALWPEISRWDFFKAIFHYQYQRKYARPFSKHFS